MKQPATGLLTAAVLILPGLGALGAAPPPGFDVLFDGRDLAAFKVPAGDNGHWRVSDGAIDYDARSEAGDDKNLWSVREFGDFVLRLDWRIKETPYVNPRVPLIKPDGTHKRGADGKEITMSVPDSDSGVFLRGSSKAQVNIWCWPVGSGEVWGYRTDAAQPPEVRAAVTPRARADAPIGEWNRFRITMKGDRLTVVLNGQTVIERARLPGVPARGALALQHHGAPIQFANLYVRDAP
jgi:hypothetical protein